MLLWLPVSPQLFAAPWCMVVPSRTVGTCQVHWQGVVRGAMKLGFCGSPLLAGEVRGASRCQGLSPTMAGKCCGSVVHGTEWRHFQDTDHAGDGVGTDWCSLRAPWALSLPLLAWSVVRSGEPGQGDIGVLAVDLAARQLLEGGPSSHLSKRGRPQGPLSRGMRSHLGRRPGC